MPIEMTATESQFPEYEPGIYRARLARLEEEESDFIDENTGDKKWQYVWHFEILEDERKGQTLRAWSNVAFGPRSKARGWVEALIGREIQVGERFSEDDLIGREADLMIRLEESKKGRGTFAKVDSVNPVRKKRDQKKAEEAVDEALEEDVKDLPF